MRRMIAWRRALAAFTLVAFVSACKDEPKPKKADDEDEEESRPKPAQISASASSGAAASADLAAAVANAVASVKPGGASPALPEKPKDAITLDNGKNTVAIGVTPEGAAKLVAYDAKGATIEGEKVKGTIRPAGGEAVTLKADGSALAGQLPKLEQGLTTLELALTIDGEKFEETLDVPEGGTKALLDKPRKEIPPGTKGPNGGTVEVIGEHIVEVVIDEETDDLRVYFLNDKLEVIDVPEGTEIELNIEDEGAP